MNAVIGSTLIYEDYGACVIEGENTQVKYQFCLKPAKDRIFYAGFDPIERKELIDSSFKPGSDLTTQQYKFESITTGIRGNVHYNYMSALGTHEIFLDETNPGSFSGTLVNAIKHLLDGYDVDASRLEKLNVNITPPPSATRRDVIHSLAVQYGFFWKKNEKEKKFEFFTWENPIPGEGGMKTASLKEFPGGIVTVSDDAIGQIGAKISIKGEDVLISMIEVNSLGGFGEVKTYCIREREYFDRESLVKQKGYSERISVDLLAKRQGFENFVARITSEENHYLHGSYLENGSQANLDKANRETPGQIHRARETSPWATVDGYGIAFPKNVGESVSILCPISASMSVNVADVIQGIENNEGKDFVLVFPDGSELRYKTDDKKWHMSGPEIIIDGKVKLGGAGATQGVVKEDDLQALANVYNTHTHPAIGSPPSITVGKVTSSKKVKSE